jgi:hypothetical protein
MLFCVLWRNDPRPRSATECVQDSETLKAAKAQQKDRRAINNNSSCQQLTEASHLEPQACLHRNNYNFCDVSTQTDIAVIFSAATTQLL